MSDNCSLQQRVEVVMTLIASRGYQPAPLTDMLLTLLFPEVSPTERHLLITNAQGRLNEQPA